MRMRFFPVAMVLLLSCAAPAPSASPSASAAEGCRTTLPTGGTPPGEDSSPNVYTNGRLYTGLPTNGEILADDSFIEADGSIGWKFAWWRAPGVGAAGDLRITGHEISTGLPITVSIPDGYGQRFQASGITFPTEGCYEITATTGDTHLTFVTKVKKVTSSVARPSVTGTAGASPGPCQLTLGTKGVQPPDAVAPDPSVLPVPWVDRWYGNEAIWIRLPTDGVLPAQPDPAATDHDAGTLYTKFPWWRVLGGQLLASARSLDRSSGQFDAEIGSVSEYGPTGFVPSILTFDHAGCWEITASLGGQTLSFVTRVVARQL